MASGWLWPMPLVLFVGVADAVERGGISGAEGGGETLLTASGGTEAAEGSGVGSGARGGDAADALLSGWVVKVKPRPRSAKGPTMASITSTFRVTRRARSAGFKRGKISCNGKLINLLSSSPAEFTKIPGAKCRNSPKEILTAPKANWLITISACNRIVPLAGGAAGTPGGFMVLFGGSNASNVALDDTWLWNGVRWAKASPAVSPSARDGSAAGVLGGKLVLFGGEQGYAEAVLDDTWVWDGSMSTWAQENVTGPPGRAYAASAVLNGELVVFGGRVAFQDGGGSVALGDTWTWNGSRWTELHIPGPSARYYTSMAAQVF